MRKPIVLLLSLLSLCLPSFLPAQELSSPDGTLKLEIDTGNGVTWLLTMDNRPVTGPNPLSMILDRGMNPGKDPVSYEVHTRINSSDLDVPVPVKTRSIRDEYNELTLASEQGYAIHFRLYDQGLAYRFETFLPGKLKILNENATFIFPEGYTAFFPEEENLVSHYERDYQVLGLDSLKKDSFCSLPLLLSSKDICLAITESDLYDYPGMFLKVSGKSRLAGLFPPVVLEARPGRNADRSEIITQEADHIAETDGTRTYPWRIVMVARNEKDLLLNQLVYTLARPAPEARNSEWLRPGKVMWDWWNALNVYGVNFRAGINTDTYKYYIDAASEFGLDYIILDEGWSPTTRILETVPEIDLPALIHYGKERGVGIILWVLWKPLGQDMENILSRYHEWGIMGIKVDFMQRADQSMVNFYERVADCAFRNELLVDFHGAYKPSGLRRQYPNVLNYEGVKGMEHHKWSEAITPDHNLTLPFSRMLAGPMDYTPGAMINATRENFRILYTEPMSQGTRAHQAAMYVVYEAPLQMLSDNPSHYLREPDFTRFISGIPVTWDDIHVIDGKIGDFLLLARKKGEDWYLAAMTDWTSREFDISLDFLGEGVYSLQFIEDGLNADRKASDYAMGEAEVDNQSSLHIRMAEGGGWVGVLRKME